MQTTTPTQPVTLNLAPTLSTNVATGPVSDPVVPYHEFKPENLFALSVESKKSAHTDPTKQISYMSMPLLYNYGTPENKIVKDLHMELAEAYSTGGIYEKEDDRGKSSFSLLLKFSSARPETKTFLTHHKIFYTAVAQTIFAQKGPLKCFEMDKDRPATTFKDLVQYRRDKVSGEVIPGSDPQMYVKVKPWSAVFVGLDGKPIPWRVLQNVNMTGIPLVHYESIYAGGNGKASLQAKLVSMVVTKVEPRGNANLQQGTVKKYAE